MDAVSTTAYIPNLPLARRVVRQRGARSGIRTHMPRRAAGFEPTASASCAIRADGTTLVRRRRRQVVVAESEERRERIDGWVLTGLARMDLEVQVRAGRVAGHPHVADHIARVHEPVVALVAGEVRVVVGVAVDAREPCTIAAVAPDVVT